MAIAKNSTLNFLLDILFISIAFILCMYFKYDAANTNLSNYYGSFVIFIAIWMLFSFIFQKYQYHQERSLPHFLANILKSNLLTLLLVAAVMYITRQSHYSRFIVLGTIGLATLFESIFITTYFSLTRIQNMEEHFSQNSLTVENKPQAKKEWRNNKREKQLLSRQEALFVELSKRAFNYIFQHADINSPDTLIISTTSRFNIDSQLKDQFSSIVNIGKINNIRYLNKFFEAANLKLSEGGLFIDYVETKNLRKSRILKKFPPIINYIYYIFDFILKRVFPKFSLTKKIYFTLTRGQNRVLTKAETFGRLYSCGFEIIDEQEIDNFLFFVARKTGTPHFPADPTYGPFIRLKRYGKNKKLIKVYKLRTMHPFAEYLQDYMYNKKGLKEGGKFHSDFRISNAGKVFRTFWLDELPMLYNMLKGELKLVGVRPLSPHYFSLYNKELQDLRTKYKPGLVPPFYADMPKTLEEIMASEMKYLKAYEKHPMLTDIKYFFKSMVNILFKKSRSS